MRDELVSYMKQDVLLLGGIMLKAQSLCWEQYGVDIDNILTVSSLALTIFRKRYYSEKENPIYMLNRNQDHFICKGDFGGHSDVYIPTGANLFSLIGYAAVVRRKVSSCSYSSDGRNETHLTELN